MRARLINDKFGLTIVKKHSLRTTRIERDDPQRLLTRIGGAAAGILAVLSSDQAPDLALRTLTLFDCLLRVLDEPVIHSPLAFATKRFETIQKLFYGALGSKYFIDATPVTRVALARTFGNLIEQLSLSTPVALLEYKQAYANRIPVEFIKYFEETPLNVEQVKLLRSFTLISDSGVEYDTLLAPLAASLGDTFVDSFHNALKNIARSKAKDSALRDFGTTFAGFVHQQEQTNKPVTINSLRDPDAVYLLIVDFMEYHFMKMTRRDFPVQESTLPSLQKLWSRYITYWTKLSNDGVLAMPGFPFPAGNPSLLNNNSIGHQRVVVQSDGTHNMVTHKLITEVPLHLTDEEATQILFRQLKQDFSVVQSWLGNHLDAFFADRRQGIDISDAIDRLPTDDELRGRFTWQKDADTVALAVKYFRVRFCGYVDTSNKCTIVYPNCDAREGPLKSQVARYLGIPSRREALAIMGFLASTDGRFSESALSACTLTDRNGTRINAVETDAGMSLSVLKERDAKNGWHDVILDNTATAYVRQWISATKPLRDYMRENAIIGWTNLFIYTGSPLGKPNYFQRSTNLNNSFRKFAKEHEEELGAAANIVSIPRIRSTRGILIFLEKMDLSAMARELGNTEITSLRHYLPDSLWEYFALRWLRIFQNLIIVEATRNTIYMQRALKFTDAVEMDTFLRNHALTSLLPPDDEDPHDPVSSNLSEIIVAASPGVFAILMSISEAAKRAESEGRTITPQALYWMEFADRLSAHIQSDQFHQREIKQMMSNAMENTDSKNFMQVVCA